MLQVYCQPIQYGAHIDQRTVLPYDTTTLAPHAWQPDYFEADLSTPAAYQGTHHSSSGSNSLHTQPPAQHSNWKALAAPQPVFTFDFNTQDPLRDFQPTDRQLSFTINAAGVCNAIAFWFDLKLDEHTTLSSSPYLQDAGRPSTTWKQVSIGCHRRCYPAYNFVEESSSRLSLHGVAVPGLAWHVKP